MTLNTMLDNITPDGAEIQPGWSQGRATFGGLVAALMQVHLEKTLSEGRPLRSATIAFIGPAVAGPISLRSELIRSGKSALQAECRALQGGQVVAILLASFGQARASSISVASAAAPHFLPPDQGRRLPYIPGLVPEFTQQFEFSWAHGDLPFTASASADIGGWVRLREAAGLSTGPALIMALVDAWPPAPIPMYRTPAPISTMTWTLDLLPPAEGLAADGWWQYLAETQASRDGYATTRASLWTAAGELVAISQQSIAVFQ